MKLTKTEIKARLLRRQAFRNAQDMRDFARAHSPAALQTLVEIYEEPTAPFDARISAAKYIVDQAWGKPINQVIVDRIDDAKVIDMIDAAETDTDMLMNSPLQIEDLSKDKPRERIKLKRLPRDG